MSAELIKMISVSVTGGDAIQNNRLSGKSNTGTYFLSSYKSWDNFKNFFNEDGITSYQLDLKRIVNYKNQFLNYFYDYRKKNYPDSMRYFIDICDSLVNYEDNPIIDFELRINEPRIFLKFKDNNGEVEYALRRIIYSDLTKLIFIKNGDRKIFYLDINFDEIKMEELR